MLQAFERLEHIVFFILITENENDMSFQFSACSGLLKSIILRSTPLPVRSEVFFSEKTVRRYGGAKRDRTADLLRARQALSQLSYSPIQLLQRPLLPLNRVHFVRNAIRAQARHVSAKHSELCEPET